MERISSVAASIGIDPRIGKGVVAALHFPRLHAQAGQTGTCVQESAGAGSLFAGSGATHHLVAAGQGDYRRSGRGDADGKVENLVQPEIQGKIGG